MPDTDLPEIKLSGTEDGALWAACGGCEHEWELPGWETVDMIAARLRDHRCDEYRAAAGRYGNYRRRAVVGQLPACRCPCLACGGTFAGHCLHQGTHPVVAPEWATEARDALRSLLGPLPRKGAAEPLSCGCPPEHHDEAIRRLADTMRRDGVITEES